MPGSGSDRKSERTRVDILSGNDYHSWKPFVYLGCWDQHFSNLNQVNLTPKCQILNLTPKKGLFYQSPQEKFSIILTWVWPKKIIFHFSSVWNISPWWERVSVGGDVTLQSRSDVTPDTAWLRQLRLRQNRVIRQNMWITADTKITMHWGNPGCHYPHIWWIQDYLRTILRTRALASYKWKYVNNSIASQVYLCSDGILASIVGVIISVVCGSYNTFIVCEMIWKYL